MLRAAAACLLAASALHAQSFTSELWKSIGPVYRKTLEHPYLKGLADGTLPKSRFHFYLLQDAHYLRAFAQALHVLASKAPREDWALTLGRHATEALEVERGLHQSLLAEAGIGAGRMAAAEPAPSNYAYTTHLLAAVHRGTFAEGLAAVLPCYWIYWEVGKELKKAGSKDPAYQRWIDQYAGADYGKIVGQVLDMMNAQAARIPAAEREQARRLFLLSARYEYLFWDAAWRQEQWLP